MASFMDPDMTLTSFKKFKFVFLGDQGVGKSSIIQRYIQDSFNVDQSPTIGIDFSIKNIQINDQTYKLHLWDTAGQERFKSLIPAYIKDCQVAIIVYDITNQESFKNVANWYKTIQEQAGEQIVLGLIGNKTDLPNQAVTTQEGMSKADQIQAFYQEVSAKSGDKVDEFFKQIIESIVQADDNQK